MASSGDSDGGVESEGSFESKNSRLYAISSLETLALDSSSIAFESLIYLGVLLVRPVL